MRGYKLPICMMMIIWACLSGVLTSNVLHLISSALNENKLIVRLNVDEQVSIGI